MAKEYIFGDKTDWDTAECICGNHAFGDGFSDSDKLCNPGKPKKDWDLRLVVCLHCGRIINPETFEVAGENPKVGVFA
jgi:hypothetical protein